MLCAALIKLLLHPGQQPVWERCAGKQRVEGGP